MIKNLKLSVILNSAKKKTIKAAAFTGTGTYSASVPSGTSKGKNEAIELSIDEVLKVFPDVRSSIIGMDEREPEKIDAELQRIDGTRNFKRIGGNLALAISIAVARASCKNELWKMKPAKNLHKNKSYSFPIPIGNVIGGGAHGGGSNWQEFLVIPHRAKSPGEALETMTRVWSSAGRELKKKGLAAGKNLEGAWKARLDDIGTLELLSKIAENDGHDVRLGIDFAASNLWNGKSYSYRHAKNMKRQLRTEEQLDFIIETAKKYKLFYLEDPFHEEDFTSFSELTRKLGRNCLIVGDDLYCTNIERLKRGLKKRASNTVTIKPNQVGTLTQAAEAAQFALKKRMTPVISHRSRETMDSWMSDLALAWGIPLIKTGIHGSGRLAKHRRLIELWKRAPNPRIASVEMD